MSAGTDQPGSRASQLAATALRQALANDAWAGRRTYCTGLLGLGPAALHAALMTEATAEVDVTLGTGTRSVAAIQTGSNLLLPYLVTDTSSSSNSGSSGFAATLRTQFLQNSTEPRVLLVLADRPDETITSASDDLSLDSSLTYRQLVRSCVRSRLVTPPADGTLLAEVVASLRDTASAIPGWARLERLDTFLRDHGADTPHELGRSLHLLGEFLSDPAASSSPRARLRSGRSWRSLIETAAATPSRSLEHHLRAKRASPEGAQKVANATGPRGIDWTAFTLADLESGQAAPPLELSPSSPVHGARLALVGARGSVVAWLPSAGGDLTLNLNRALLDGERVTVRLGDTPLAAATIEATAVVGIPALPGRRWAFGWIELSDAEPLPVAITFDDAPVVAVEDGLMVDPVRGAFLCGEDPQLRCWAASGRDLGLAILDDGEADAEDEPVPVTGRAPSGESVGPVPVLAQGGSDQGTDDPDPGEGGLPDPPTGEDDPDPEPDPEDEPEPQEGREHASVAHVLHTSESLEWPVGTGVSGEPGDMVVAALVQNTRHTVKPRLGTTRLLEVEQRTHAHPEWAQFQVVPGADDAACIATLPDPQPQWAAEMAAFSAARTAYFEAASAAGSAYAVDPLSAVASDYVRAYRSLLMALPRAGLHRSEFDLLIAIDLVEVAGIEEILVSPMSPLSVAFHGQLLTRLREDTSRERPLARGDVDSFKLQWTVPLLRHSGTWHESVPADRACLWRIYATIQEAGEGTHSRSAVFIKNRIQFFLAVHPSLAGPENTLAIACASPGDGQPILDALRQLMRAELGEHPDGQAYVLPRFDVTLVGAGGDVRDTLGALSAGGAHAEVDRVIKTRCTIRSRTSSSPPGFAHLSFLFRTPGGRTTSPVDMRRRAATNYVHGLASTPGRVRVEDAEDVFATGVFAWEPTPDAPDLEAIQYRTLELVGGQGGERLLPGETRMVRARAGGDTIESWYDHSAWVVHLDRMLGIEAFRPESGKSLLEYEDRAEPAAFGYDGITATRFLAPYLSALRLAVADIVSLPEAAARRVMAVLESVSGRWTLQIIQRPLPKVRERIGTACATDYVGRAEHALEPSDDSVCALVALEEVVPGFPVAGVSQYQRSRTGGPRAPICDDLLLLRLTPRDSQPPLLSATVIEVKFNSTGAPDLAHAASQIFETNQWLENRFGQESPSKDLRGAELAELMRSATARNTTFGLGAGIGAHPTALGEAGIAQMGRGEYELVTGSRRGPRARRGVIVSVEASAPGGPSLQQVNGQDGPVDVVRLGQSWMRDILGGHMPERPGDWPALGPAQSDNGDDGGGPGTPPEPAPPTPPAATPPQAAPTAAPRTDSAQIAETAAKLDQAFFRYGLPVEGFDPALAQRGPSLTRYRTRGVGKLAIADIERRARDLTREIEAPGQILIGDEPGYITVDVPRLDRENVPLASLLAGLDVPTAPGALEFIVGVTPSGDIRTADLSRLPHLLVAGATGSGKSVFLRGLLVELLRARTPEQLQLLIVDPKRLDFTPFQRAPHHRGHILHDTDEALQTLQFTLGAEIDLRQPLLQRAGASSASEFYEAGGTLEELPQLVIVIDEFADLVLAGSDRKAFSEMIQRYAQLTRAYGIYLVLATQRPSVDVITGSIKANLTARMAFSLPSYRDSMTILDRAGAEDLLGNGDMLFYRNGKVERLQAPFTSLADVNAVLGAP